MAKKVGRAFGAILLIILLATAGLVYRHYRSKKDENQGGLIQVSIRLKWLNQAQFAGFYIASQNGFYRKHGLQVEIRPGGSEFPAIPDVASGYDDFGIAGADQILIAKSQGAPIVAVSAIYRQTPLVLFSFKEKGIQKATDLKGKRVGVKPGGNEELTYRAILSAAHVDSSTLREIPVKYDMTPLFEGLVDVWPGYTINEVLVAREKGKDLNIINPGDYGISLYADTLFATDRLVREKPGVVSNFVAATLEGWQYAMDHPEDAARATLQFDPQLNYSHELAMMKESIRSLKPDANPVGTMDLDSWKEMRNLLINLKFMTMPVDVEKVFDPRFVKDFYGRN